MALVSDPVSAIAGVVQSVIERFPTQEQKDAAKLQLAQLYVNGDLQRMTAQAGVVMAEANSANKLSSSWRPILMLTITAIIANNYFFYPYLQAMFGWGVHLDLPPQLWNLINLGVGGYVMGRSVEKIADKVVPALKDKWAALPAPSAASNPAAFNTNGG